MESNSIADAFCVDTTTFLYVIEYTLISRPHRKLFLNKDEFLAKLRFLRVLEVEDLHAYLVRMELIREF